LKKETERKEYVQQDRKIHIYFCKKIKGKKEMLLNEKGLCQLGPKGMFQIRLKMIQQNLKIINSVSVGILTRIEFIKVHVCD
jgi:hypothetical protein